MLVSHHAPCDYDRTVSFFGLRVCTRCLGMLSGTLVGWFLAYECALLGQAWYFIGTLALTLPAAFDFAAHELSTRYRSTNLRRIATGLSFGIVIGVYLSTAWYGNTWSLLGLIVYLALMQVAIVKLFQIRGHFDSYLERYASATYKEEEVEQVPPDGRGEAPRH